MSRFDEATSKTSYASVLVAGTVMISCAGAAQAGNWDNWKEFRDMNPGVSGRVLRSLYREHYGVGTDNNKGNVPPISILPVYPDAGGGVPPVQVSAVTTFGGDLAGRVRNNRSFQINNGKTISMGAGVDIDLASSDKNIRLGNKLFKNVDSVQIQVGELTKTLAAGSEVTAAEYVAAKQVLAGQEQKLELDSAGKAIGGAVDFASISFKNDRLKVDDLNIPVNVTAYGDFSKNQIFSVTGDLTNAGNVYAFSSGQHVRRSTFAADNVINYEGGVITTDVSAVNELASFGSKATNLNIKGNDKVLNSGTISSSGNLNISAGTLVENSGSLIAAGDVSIFSPEIKNGGLIRSINANVTLDGPVDSQLTITNGGGTLMASEGAINIRTSSPASNMNTYVTGGNLFSKEVNVNAGRGSAEISVGELTGTLNQKGLASHVSADTAVLSLGNICLTGDPTYSNTGDISIDGDIIVDAALTIIASGNITNSTAVTLSANNATQGFDITIIAGALINTGGTSGPTLPTDAGGVATTINGTNSTSGGNIVFGENGAVNINSRSGGKTGDGGDVRLYAFASNLNTNGNISYSAGSITTGGKGSGNNGDVLIISGASGGENILPNINTTGGTGSGGDIVFIAAQPAGGPLTYNADGSTAGTPLAAGAVPSSPAPLRVNGSLTAADDININVDDGELSWTFNSKFNVTTTNKLDGEVTLIANGIDVNNTNFFSTPVLNILLGAGDLGEAGVVALQTDASRIDAIGSMATSEIVIVSDNKGLVLFSGQANNINFGSQGTFMSTPGEAIIGDTVLIGSFGAGAGLNSANPVLVDAENLFVTGGKKGDVFVRNIHGNDWTLLDTTVMRAKNTFEIQSDNDMGMLPTAVISAANVFLRSNTEFSSLNGTINGSSTVTLSSNNSINSVSAVPAAINTPRLILSTNNGDITYTVGAGTASLTANAINGMATVTGPTGVKSFELAGGVTRDSYLYTGNVNLTLSGVIDVGEDASFINNSASITTKAATINAESILIQIADASNTKNKISLGANTTLQTFASPGSGDITISFGTVSMVAGTQPAKGVTAQLLGGSIFWGQAGITAKGSNTVIAKDADVIFSNSTSAKNISLGGNVIIFADPPPEGSAPSMLSRAETFASALAEVMGASQVPSSLTGGLSQSSQFGQSDSSSQSSRSAMLGNATSGMMSGFTGFDTSSLIGGNDAIAGSPLSVSGIMDGAQVQTALNTVNQSQLNLITVEQATDVASLVADDSYVISRGPSTSFHSGSICAEDAVYNAISEGGVEACPALAGVTKTVLSNHVEAPRGKTLFVPNAQMTVSTRFGDVELSGGSVVLISNESNGIAIYNVCDQSKNSVALNVAGQKMTVSPGRHLLVTQDRSSDFASVNHVESVMHRNVETASLSSTLTVHSSEFSVPSAMSGVLPLRALVESKHPDARKIAQKVVKTTAVLLHLGVNSGEFQHFVKPRMTALR